MNASRIALDPRLLGVRGSLICLRNGGSKRKVLSQRTSLNKVRLAASSSSYNVLLQEIWVSLLRSVVLSSI
jgi:hypothetical protein